MRRYIVFCLLLFVTNIQAQQYVGSTGLVHVPTAEMDTVGMAYLVRKFVSFWGKLSNILRHFMIFPKDSIVFFGGVIRSGMYAAVRGE